MMLTPLQVGAVTPPAEVAPEAAEPGDGGEVIVRVRRRRRAAAATRTDASVARQLPGTQGDAVRVVESLPGIGRTSFGSGELIVWGASPDQSRAYVDGVPIPLLFHGSGLRSTLNGFFVGNIELTPGGYGASWGRALAGMVQVDTAPMREGVHGYASVDLLDASAALSAQVGERVTVGVGARYGLIDRVASSVASAQALQYLSVPQYGDYQARIEVRPTDTSRLTGFVFGSRDDGANRFTGDDPARARSLERSNEFHRAVLRYTRQLDDGARLALGAWVGVDASRRSEQVGAYPSELTADVLRGGLRASWQRDLAPWARLDVGVDVEVSSWDLTRRGSLLRPAREGDVSVFGQAPTPDLNADTWRVRQALVAPYLEVPLTFFGERLQVVPGLRLEADLTDVSRRYPAAGDAPGYGVASLAASPEPRLLVLARPLPWLQVKAAGGLYHAAPRPEDLSSVFGSPTLQGARAWQGLAGATVSFGRAVTFEALGFVRAGSSLPERVAGVPRVGSALANTGESLAYGGQFTLRCAPTRGFTGWLSYTVQRSEVTDREGAPTRLSDYDQTHLLTAVGSVQLPLGFSAGARFRLLTGLPRTPVVGRFYDALTGDYQPLFGATNSDRLPMIASADVRVDKRFRVGRMELVVFLDVLNVLNRPIAEEVLWDPTYARQGYISGLPLLADLGLRGEW